MLNILYQKDNKCLMGSQSLVKVDNFFYIKELLKPLFYKD